MENNNKPEQKIKRKNLIIFIILVILFMLSLWGCSRAVFGAEEESASGSNSSFVTYLPASFSVGVEQIYTFSDGTPFILYPNNDSDVPSFSYVFVYRRPKDSTNPSDKLYVIYSRSPFCMRTELQDDNTYKYYLCYEDRNEFCYDYDLNRLGKELWDSSMGETRVYLDSGCFTNSSVYKTEGGYNQKTSEVFLSSSVQPRTEVAGMTGQEIAKAVLAGVVGLLGCTTGLVMALMAFRKGWAFLKTILHKA